MQTQQQPRRHPAMTIESSPFPTPAQHWYIVVMNLEKNCWETYDAWHYKRGDAEVQAELYMEDESNQGNHIVLDIRDRFHDLESMSKEVASLFNTVGENLIACGDILTLVSASEQPDELRHRAYEHFGNVRRMIFDLDSMINEHQFFNAGAE